MQVFWNDQLVGCVATFRVAGCNAKQSRNDNPTGDLQMAADQTRHHPLCGPVRYSLSLRDVEELLEERGLNVDHTTVWRWVQYYGPELEQRLRRHLKADRQVVAGGRNLCPREGALVLLVSGHRFRGCHHRFLAVSVS